MSRKPPNGQRTDKSGQHQSKAGGKSTSTTDEKKSLDLSNANAGKVYLQTVKSLANGRNVTYKLRVIIDSGSQRSYISKKAVRALGLKRRKWVTLTHYLFGGGELQKQLHGQYKVNLTNLDGSYSDSFVLLDQEKICGHVNPVDDTALLDELRVHGIELTDVYDGQDRDIHILIGADLCRRVLTGKMYHMDNGIVATETKFGWTIMGSTDDESGQEDNAMFATSLHVNSFEIQDLWKLDVLGITDATETKSREDLTQASLQHFAATVKQDDSGRYEVSLPWIEGHPPVPVNRNIAETRLRNATRKLASHQMFEAYDQIFTEWEKEGIITEVRDKHESCSYLPHRPVFRESKTTPIRPVFDASAKPKGSPSLNQCLEKGANLIELIPDLLRKFRQRKYGLTADIRKAFLQISVREDDRDFLRFLWWHEDRESIKVYRHSRVVFGLTSSPFLLAATIKHHLSQQKFESNNVASLLARSFYVDNCLLSLDSLEEVQKFIEEGSEIMMQAKFELRDWMWNEPEACDNDPITVLGLKWYRDTDKLGVDVKSLHTMDEEAVISKRKVMSACHRVFDPIGFCCPATIGIKKMVQEAWRKNKSWDEPLDDDMQVQFARWKQEALLLENVQVSRWILPIKGVKTLHIFCDASATAYATVIFLRIENASITTVRFVDAKTRLATIRKTTIPRLELLSCLIGARLGARVRENLGVDDTEEVYWTDSSSALYWIQRQENWAQFVYNRVHEISDLTDAEKWRHISGEFNPADLPSRGCSPAKLLESEWWEGPNWLYLPQSEWPTSKVMYDMETIEGERKKTVVSAISTKKEEKTPWYLELYEKKRQVTYPQMLRVIAWMLRWRRIKSGDKLIEQEEYDAAEKALIKMVQEEAISVDDQRTKQLHAVRDNEGLLRVKTKILNRVDEESFRLPLLLPTDHPVTKLIVEFVHRNLYHCGVQALQSALREKYWIPKCRQLARHVVHQCPRCRRFEARRADVPEAPLPQDRVRDAVAFEVTGIDLGGPLYLKDKQKAWFVLFTCAAYRAAHLELVTSLSTKALVGALERFIARRGCPSVIFSDNGTNLVGVRNELLRVNFGIKWKLNSPAAPWWGGWFERVIGMTKKLILRILGRGVADYEEMVTILANCERVINARPLTYLAEDNEDLIPLTPEMFLREPRTQGEIDISDLKVEFGSKYEKRKQQLKDFRKRFRTEYLGLLVHRDNRKKQRQLKVGDIVLVEVENKKQLNWPIGRITKVLDGTDNGGRLVEVKTKNGVFKRAVQRLFPLEVPTEDLVQFTKEIKLTEKEVVTEKTKVKDKADKIFTRSGREVKLPLKLRN